MIYATPAELWVYMGKAGEPDAEFIEKTTPLLRRASSLVGQAIRGAIYTADSLGFPVDVGHLLAVTEATCEQAMSWHLAGVDPYTAAQTAAQIVTQKSLGSASVSFEANGEAQARRNSLASGDELTGEAWRILEAAGMLSTSVVSRGTYFARLTPPPVESIDGGTP